MKKESYTHNTIAIVDDDTTFRFIFSVQLLEINVANKIIQFEDGFGMLEYLLEHKETPELLPDTIFLDLNMKQVDGWVFLEEYENAKKYIPKEITIHIITGSSEEEDRLKAKDNSLVVDYITKPIDSKQLRTTLGYN